MHYNCVQWLCQQHQWQLMHTLGHQDISLLHLSLHSFESHKFHESSSKPSSALWETLRSSFAFNMKRAALCEGNDVTAPGEGEPQGEICDSSGISRSPISLRGLFVCSHHKLRMMLHDVLPVWPIWSTHSWTFLNSACDMKVWIPRMHCSNMPKHWLKRRSGIVEAYRTGILAWSGSHCSN